MDAAAEQEKKNNRGHIPLEIVEKILVHLPIKSVIRFSRVSKPWKSLISEPSFAAVRDPRRLLMSPPFPRSRYKVLADVSSCPLSSTSSDNAVENATPIIFPIEGTPFLRGTGELWCVEVNHSLYLWNPSINSYKKLPNPSLPNLPFQSGYDQFKYSYGLGIDSASDDYKIILLQLSISSCKLRCELYSLMSDSWRMIDHRLPAGDYILSHKRVFVSGALHWSVVPPENIVAFDLATEKFGYIAPPPRDEEVGRMSVSELRGKLCAHYNWSDRLETFHIVIWAMEEYGIEKSWSKIFYFSNKDSDGIPLDPDYGCVSRRYMPDEVAPLYMFDNGDILFIVCIWEVMLKNGHIADIVGPLEMRRALFIYKGEEARPWKMVCRGMSDGFVYDESLFSPLKFVKSKKKK